jgi:hypothetical protein
MPCSLVALRAAKIDLAQTSSKPCNFVQAQRLPWSSSYRTSLFPVPWHYPLRPRLDQSSASFGKHCQQPPAFVPTHRNCNVPSLCAGKSPQSSTIVTLSISSRTQSSLRTALYPWLHRGTAHTPCTASPARSISRPSEPSLTVPASSLSTSIHLLPARCHPQWATSLAWLI